MKWQDTARERARSKRAERNGTTHHDDAPDDDCIESMPLPCEAWPTMRQEAYHGLIGEIVRRVEPESEADPVAILAQMLVACGNSVGRTVHARVEGDRHYPNLFLAPAGKSGHGRKGTSWGRVHQFMEIGDPDWIKNCIASGMSSGEGLIKRVRDSRAAEDSAGEMTIVDSGVTDKRLMVVETEFGQVLRNLKRESNTLSAIIRMAWDRGNLGTLTSKNSLTATNAHISIVAQITEAELHRYFDEVDLFNGFANRFLWILVRRSKLLPEGGRHLEMEHLARELRDALAAARRLGELERSDEAREIWVEAYPRLTAGRPGLGGIVTSRAEAQVLRLAVLYAAMAASPYIMPDHLRAALAFWDFCEESARLIFGGEERLDPFAEALLAKIEAAVDVGLTRTDIRDAFHRNRKSKEIVAALGRLLSAGKARFEKRETGKKPVETWFGAGTT